MLQILRLALRQSTQTDLSDNLDVMILSTGGEDETGFDVFSLNYRISSPLSVIFTQNSIQNYLSIFTFLWRLKRTEHSLTNCWTNSMCYERMNSKKNFSLVHRTHLLRNEIHHFVHVVSSYLMYEVVQFRFLQFLEHVPKSSDLDELISRHEEYVSQLLNGCFLSDRGKNKEISLQLEHILEVVQNFTQLHESIFQSLLEKVDFDVEDTEEMLDEITKQFRDYLSDFQNLADIGKGYCFEIDSRFEDRLEL